MPVQENTSVSYVSSRRAGDECQTGLLPSQKEVADFNNPMPA